MADSGSQHLLLCVFSLGGDGTGEKVHQQKAKRKKLAIRTQRSTS